MLFIMHCIAHRFQFYTIQRSFHRRIPQLRPTRDVYRETLHKYFLLYNNAPFLSFTWLILERNLHLKFFHHIITAFLGPLDMILENSEVQVEGEIWKFIDWSRVDWLQNNCTDSGCGFHNVTQKCVYNIKDMCRLKKNYFSTLIS